MPQTTRVAKPCVVRRRGRGKFYGGIRAEEIQNVRRGNVVGDQGLIGFVSKGVKQRSVALPPQAPKIISEYATSNVLRARSSDAYRRADPAGVLPLSAAHRRDVRCGGRPHGRTSAEGRRPAGVQHGVQAAGGAANPERGEDGRGAQSRAGYLPERHPHLETIRGGGRDDGGAGQ